MRRSQPASARTRCGQHSPRGISAWPKSSTYRRPASTPGNPIPAVNKLDLDVADGEFVVLVGPSGSGKSTALRMLAGLEDVDQGEIRIGGVDVSQKPPKDRDIAMVFQNYALYPHMSVAENMGFALKLKGVSKEERAAKVLAAAKLLDLEKYLDRKPKALSGGQRQRVAMGRAIVREPSVFLMDEPLSNLDAKLRVETRANIAALQARLGTTTIYVTHDQVEAMTMGDRVALLKDGILQQVDTPRNLYDSPGNAFVAGFIGSPAMNLVKVPFTDAGAAARRPDHPDQAGRRGRRPGGRPEGDHPGHPAGVLPRLRGRPGPQAQGHPGRGTRRGRLRLRRAARHEDPRRRRRRRRQAVHRPLRRPGAARRSATRSPWTCAPTRPTRSTPRPASASAPERSHRTAARRGRRPPTASPFASLAGCRSTC